MTPEREAELRRRAEALVRYHNEHALGASWEHHARMATTAMDLLLAALEARVPLSQEASERAALVDRVASAAMRALGPESTEEVARELMNACLALRAYDAAR